MQAVRQCTICEARDVGYAPRVNPKLCSDCQDWDDLLHVNLCRERTESHAAVNPVLFCYKHNPDWPPSRKGGYSELKDMTFRSGEYFAARRECIMCSAVGDALQRARDESGDGQVTKIAVWRPFILDPGKNQWNVRDEQTAMEKGMVPWLQKCVLAICIATAPAGGDSWSYQPSIVELVLRYESWCYDLSQVTPWERKVMDTGQIARWLDRCVHEHGEECSSTWIPRSVKPPRGFRLIDVHERRVVLLETEVKYAALSYVWSVASASPDKLKLQLYSENLKSLEEPNSLHSSILPEVVDDAINLCVDIGQRYLWVDRFCIVQDDLELKAEQIDAMGLIYDRAFLTIVSLGDGPTPGLPGLPCRPRQQSFKNRGWDLLPTMSNPVGEARLPLIDMALSESAWSKRAWTFQESALSKRKIYFDASQVYGNCPNESWQERPQDEDEAEWEKAKSWELRDLRSRAWDFGVDSFDTYSKVIAQFSPRKLTFPEDVLRAFAGIVNVLETKLKRPILVGHPEEFFTESLRWVPQPGFMGARRFVENLPSWSWASWDSKATWDTDWTIAKDTYLATRVSEVKASFVNFHVSDPQEGLRPVREQHQSLEDYLTEQKRVALKTLKEVAPSWWPSSILDDPATVEADKLNELTRQVWDWGQQKSRGDGHTHPWPPSTAGIPPTERLHDRSENETALAILRNLEEHIDTRWWPPTTANDLGAIQQMKILSNEAKSLAEGRPNSLVFNTTCAYLKVVPFGVMWFKIPPRRQLSGCIMVKDEVAVGITMAMAPQLTFDMFREKKEWLVALIGVCSCRRWMQWDKGELSRFPPRHLNELCLLVMVMEEKDGVCSRLAVGVVFSDEWVKLQPQWRTVVLA
ncbi:heterokaryon incompatibility protein-domain-containing protein [Xylaria palmicola]|nr:heterokaryon incompatibility protein-domain-containing protein [Xylaria palmicola]